LSEEFDFLLIAAWPCFDILINERALSCDGTADEILNAEDEQRDDGGGKM
jgi:hypothetical protein